MPQVPGVQANTARGDLRSGPTANPNDFGAAQGEEIQQVGAAGEQFGSRMLASGIQDSNRLQLAATRDVYSQFQNSALNDVTQNVLTLHGQDAITKNTDGQAPFDQMQDRLTKMQSDYASKLGSPAQQALFTRLSNGVIGQANRMARDHIFQQQQAYTKDTMTAEKAAETNAAVSDAWSQQPLDQAESTIVNNNKTLYQGFPDTANRATATEVGSLYTKVAQAQARTDAGKALAFANQNKDKLGPQYEPVVSSLTGQLAVQAAQRNIQTLGTQDSTSAFDAANKIEDPQTKALTIAGLQAKYTTQSNTAAKASADQGAGLMQQIVTNPDQAASIIPQDYDPTKRQQLLAQAQTLMTTPAKTDPEVFSNLVQQAHDDPQAFLRRDLTPYTTQLSTDDLNHVMTMRSEIINSTNKTSSTAALTGPVLSTFNKGIVDVPGLGLKKGSNGAYTDEKGDTLDDDEVAARKAQISGFQTDFLNRVNDALPTAKDRAQPGAVQKIMDQMTAQKVVDSKWFGMGKTKAPQGLIDEHPENYPNYDKYNPQTPGVTTPVSGNLPPTLQGLPNVKTFGQGKDMRYYQFNGDQSTADIYDSTGKKVGRWSKQ